MLIVFVCHGGVGAVIVIGSGSLLAFSVESRRKKKDNGMINPLGIDLCMIVGKR